MKRTRPSDLGRRGSRHRRFAREEAVRELEPGSIRLGILAFSWMALLVGVGAYRSTRGFRMPFDIASIPAPIAVLITIGIGVGVLGILLLITRLRAFAWSIVLVERVALGGAAMGFLWPLPRFLATLAAAGLVVFSVRQMTGGREAPERAGI